MKRDGQENPWRYMINLVTEIIAQAAKVDSQTARDSIEIPPDPTLGDLATTIAFILAKKLRKNPTAISSELVLRLVEITRDEPLIDRVETKGPYINLFFNRGRLAEFVINTIRECASDYGKTSEYAGMRALVEYPAVNPSKPWHRGHARNAIIGDTLANMLEATGLEVVRIDYINNLGLQVAQLTWQLMHTKRHRELHEKYDHYLGVLYVDAQKAFEEDTQAQEEIRQISRDLENIDSAAFKISDEMVTECLKAQNQTAYRLGIFHDYQIWESVIAHSGLLEETKRRILTCEAVTKLEEGEKAGCIVVKLDSIDEFKDMKEPYKVLFRSDGTRTYTGADVALQMWKFGVIDDPFQYIIFEEQPNGRPVYCSVLRGQKRSIGRIDYVFNVIASDQSHPQKLIYTILDLLGYKRESRNSRHVAYEYVGLEDADFSGRKGTWIGYTTDEVLDRLEELALEEVTKRNPDESDEFKRRVAAQVATGALRYFMLKASPDRKIVFRWNEALDFNGDAGPYLQYSYARSQRILEKAEHEQLNEEPDWSLLNTEQELALLKYLARLPEEVVEVVRGLIESTWATTFATNRVAVYCYELATLFSKFYDACPVLKAEPKLAAARLELVRAFKTTMANCLRMLGIPIVERM